MSVPVLPDAPSGRSIEAIRADLNDARLRTDSARYARLYAEFRAYHTAIIESRRTRDPVLCARRVVEGRATVAAMVDEWSAARAELAAGSGDE